MNENSFQRGHNPLLQTKRGKVQQRRGALNEQISKQIRLRNGAENLLRVTHDKKIRDQIALELSFLDSNLQLLKEELAELNADVQIYQNEKCASSSTMPQLALGLKETKDVEFSIPFKDIIVDHYNDSASKYELNIRQFAEMRKTVRVPPRNDGGIRSLFEYYNQLCFVEKRFYSYSRPLNTYFEWFDAITGIPAIQRSVAFEKGSILFNVAALYTQLGANEDRNDQAGLQKCVDYYSRAVGCFQYLKDNFSHSPSNDMRNETLIALIHLLLAQIQECIWQICCDQLSSIEGFHESFVLAQESSQVSKMYADTLHAITLIPYKPYLPSAWSAFVSLKRDFYEAMAHYFTAVGVLAITGDDDETRKRYRCHFVKSLQRRPFSEMYPAGGCLDNKPWCPSGVDRPPPDAASRQLMAQIHARHSCQLIDECLTGMRLNKSLRKTVGLSDCLKKFAQLLAGKQRDVSAMPGDDAADLYEAEPIAPHTTFPAIMVAPDFKKYPVEDLFNELGPLSVFNARTELCPPRRVELRRTPLCPGFGFSVKGDTPVSVSSVESDGLAATFNLLPGDYIVAVGGVDCRWASHDDVVRCIRTAGDCLAFTVVSPKRRSLADNSVRSFNSSSLSSTGHSSNNSSGHQRIKHPETDGSEGKSSLSNDSCKSNSKSSGWFSSTLPNSFKSKKICSPNEKENGLKDKTSSPLLPKTPPPNVPERKSCQNGDVILTYSNVRELKEKNTAATSPQPQTKQSGSPWRVRSFLALRKNKSDSRLNINARS